VEAFGEDRVLGGTTAQGANITAEGVVRHAGVGETVIGEPAGGTGRAETVAAIFNNAGIETGTTVELDSVIWSKLAINAAINPLTALLDVKNGRLAESEHTKELMRLAASEVAEVCERKGARLLFDDPFEKALAVANATGDNVSSMLSDVRAGRRTEVDRICGAVTNEAEGLGMDAPVNRTLRLLIKAKEEFSR